MKPTPETSAALSRILADSATLPEEYRQRSDALDADVAALAALLPTRLFKMKVRTTENARWGLPAVLTALYVAYWAFAIPACFMVGESYGAFAAFAAVPLALMFLVIGGAEAERTVPAPYKREAVVYVRDGKLYVVKAGHEEYDTAWKRTTCTQLLDEECVDVQSLVSELMRGVSTYFNRIDILDDAREVLRRSSAIVRAESEAQASSHPPSLFDTRS